MIKKTLFEKYPKKHWLELISLLKSQKYEITEALTLFIKKYPCYNNKQDKSSLSGYLSWFRRKRRITPKKNFVTNQSHSKLIHKASNKLKDLGYRTIIVGDNGYKIPDIIAIKNNKIIQVEIQRIFPSGREHYAERNKDKQYDNILIFANSQEIKKFGGIK